MKRKKTKSISLGVAINIASFVLVRSIGIITAPVMTGIMSTDDYGVLSVFNTWSGIIGIIAGLGVQGSLTNFRVKSETDEYYKYCWNSLLLGILGHVIFFLLFLPISGPLMSLLDIPDSLIYLLVLSALFQFCSSFLSVFFIIENMVLYNAIISIFSVLGSFGISLLLYYTRSGNSELYYPFVLGQLIINAIVSLFCVVFFAVKGRCRLRREYITYCIAIGLPLVAHSLAGAVLGGSDRIMLQHMEGLSKAGVYALSYNFACIISSVWSAINAVWTPFYFRFLKDSNTAEMTEKKKNFDFLYLMLTVCFILVCPEVFRLLINERYWELIRIIPILAIGFFANHMYSFAANYETYREKTKYVAMGTVGAALVNIILNLCFIPKGGGYGAAIATALSYFILFIFHLFISKKIIGNYPFARSLPVVYCIILIIAVCMFYLLYEYWWVRWAAAFAAGLILVIDIIKRRAII